MRIAAVVVTCNRTDLLPRALDSIKEQSREPDFVYIVSNSEPATYSVEQIICSEYGFSLIHNIRTQNYAGALNTAVEEIVKQNGIQDDIYFASLDDDDEWLPEYLGEIENQNNKNFDLLVGSYLRLSEDENQLMVLPDQLSSKDFLTGNPGIGGSNTFIRLKTLLKTGSFDEALSASVDRDFFVRVFQQTPSYQLINKHLVTAHTEKNRERLTINFKAKTESFQIFYYKYQHLMDEEERTKFFERANNYFSISRSQIEIKKTKSPPLQQQAIQFGVKGDYQFVIGFIAGNEIIAERIAKQIIDRSISVDLVLIIEDVPKGKSLKSCVEIFQDKNIPFQIVKHQQWKGNLAKGHYGAYFKQFSEINSIPLGRTILHHHLFTETTEFQKPVYWIIDDDISFSAITPHSESIDLFNLIEQHIGKVDGIIGSISNDPPVPTLCCIRAQLIDFLHSCQSEVAGQYDRFNLREIPDYYYDLSDFHSDHLELPIYHKSTTETDLESIFSGKALSRPALQKQLKSENRTITKRGANTLVLNREILQYYPVINLEVNNRFARRGDLLWALLNQVVSGKIILEHTFSVDHNRPVHEFHLDKELDKAAYDIIGYAFNKGILKVIDKVKKETEPNRPKDIFEKLNQSDYYNFFHDEFVRFLQLRRAKFLMNYYRIVGLTNLLSDEYQTAKEYHCQLSDETKLKVFENTLKNAQRHETLKPFFKELTTAIWTYSKSVTDISEDDEIYSGVLEKYFDLKKKLRKLGNGAEGIVFTDDNFVYKSYFNILDSEWTFLKEKSENFPSASFLEKIEFFEHEGFRFIRYPFHLFKPFKKAKPTDIISFFKFCKSNDFVYTNIKPSNFIQTNGAIKLIDYGKSFEPYTEDKFLNSIKRAFLLLEFPKMKSDAFKKLTARINMGEEPHEIQGWKKLWRAIEPRNKEEILDSKIVSIITKLKPKRVLDYGSGKCKTASRLRKETKADVLVYDIDKELLDNRCGDFQYYQPNDSSFNQSFDVALLNLVLCEVENATVQNILSNISTTLRRGGSLVISVCNPDFSHVPNTEFQNRHSIPISNSQEDVLTKTSRSSGSVKTEFHRPTSKYLEMFLDGGFTLVKTIDTDGTNLDTLENASDFKVFILKK